MNLLYYGILLDFLGRHWQNPILCCFLQLYGNSVLKNLLRILLLKIKFYFRTLGRTVLRSYRRNDSCEGNITTVCWFDCLAQWQGHTGLYTALPHLMLISLGIWTVNHLIIALFFIILELPPVLLCDCDLPVCIVGFFVIKKQCEKGWFVRSI